MRASSQAAFSAFTCVLAALGSDASCSAGGSLQSECGQQPSDGSHFSGGTKPNDEAVEVPSLMQVNAVGGHERFERGDDTVEVIVELKDAVGQDAVNKFQMPGTSGMFLNANHKLETIIIAKKDIDALQNSAGIQAVDEVVEMRAFVITPRPEAIFEGLGAEEEPYGIAQVQADQLEQGSHSVKVCVVDTGYGLGHPDLPTDVTGTDTASGNWNKDGHGHGSHCAGSIGAIGGNNVGVTSVNPDPDKFTFHIGKGLSDSGSGSSAAVLQAVVACEEAGAKIISLSLGGGSFAQATADTYKDLYENKGVLIIAAAGNSGNTAKSYPASYSHVMSVAAVDSNENKAGFSQWNDQVEIAGPGVAVKSTITGNDGDSFTYASWSGTSMATPHVAGVAALVWSHFPQCSNSQIRRVLLLTAKDKGDAGCDEKYGYGIVQAKAAYDLLSEKGCDAGGPEMPTETLGGCKDFIGQPTPVPTPMPTFPPNCLTKVQVEVRTDNYPGETEWHVKDPLGNKVMSGGPYSQKTYVYTSTDCLDSGLHTFIITDSYGDGICGPYGQGYYKVFVNGVEKVNACTFASTASHPFNVSSSAPVPTPDTTPTPPPTPPPTPVPTRDPMHLPTPDPTPLLTPVPTPDPVCDLHRVATGIYCKGTQYIFLGQGMDTCACNQKQRDTCGCSKMTFHWYKNPAWGKGRHACWCPTDMAKDVDAGGVCQGGTVETLADPSVEIYYAQNEVCELQPVTTGFYCEGTPYLYLGDGMDACSCNLKQQQWGACSKRSFHWYSAPAWGKGTGACYCPVDPTKDVSAAGFCQGGTTAKNASTAAQIFIA